MRERLDTAWAVLRRRRRLLRRSSLGRRLLRRRVGALTLALVLGWTIAQQVGNARAAERAWGRTRPVLIATQDLDAGARLGEDATTVQQVPRRLVPDGALDQLPPDARTRSVVRRGEMVLDSRLAPSGTGAGAAGLPEGTQAVTVALGDTPAPVRRGDVVDVYAVTAQDPGALDAGALDAGVASADVHAVVVARHAVVVAVTRDAATLAVDRDEVTATVGANATSRLQLVITG